MKSTELISLTISAVIAALLLYGSALEQLIFVIFIITNGKKWKSIMMIRTITNNYLYVVVKIVAL